MTDRYRKLCAEVDTATIALGDANRSAEKALDRVVGPRTVQPIRPVLVIGGKEMPHTITFKGSPAK
ncbi:MAG: hypothetical protein KBD06_04580 [Candidatus Pacebacteria bacterium]|nr:hypothetical protein [Candidatus Paceibacterota bacterium]